MPNKAFKSLANDVIEVISPPIAPVNGVKRPDNIIKMVLLSSFFTCVGVGCVCLAVRLASAASTADSLSPALLK